MRLFGDVEHHPAAGFGRSSLQERTNRARGASLTTDDFSDVLLGDAQGKLAPTAITAEAGGVSADAQAVKGRLDLIGLNAQGQPIRLVVSGISATPRPAPTIASRVWGSKAS